jgi:hypothetical protein
VAEARILLVGFALSFALAALSPLRRSCWARWRWRRLLANYYMYSERT